MPQMKTSSSTGPNVPPATHPAPLPSKGIGTSKPSVPQNNIVPFSKTVPPTNNPGIRPPSLVRGLKPAPVAQLIRNLRNLGPQALWVGTKVLVFLSPLLLGGSEARRPGFSAFALGAGGYDGDPSDARAVRAWKTEMRQAFANLTDAQQALFAEAEADVLEQLEQGALKRGSLRPAYRDAYAQIMNRTGEAANAMAGRPDAPLTRESDDNRLRPDIPPELPYGPAPPPLDFGEHVNRPWNPSTLRPSDAPLQRQPLPAREGMIFKPQELEVTPTLPPQVDRGSGAQVDFSRPGFTVDRPVGTEALVEHDEAWQLTPATQESDTFQSTDFEGTLHDTPNTQGSEESPDPETRFQELAKATGIEERQAAYILQLLRSIEDPIADDDATYYIEDIVDVLSNIAESYGGSDGQTPPELKSPAPFVKLARALGVVPMALGIALHQAHLGTDPAVVDYGDADTYRYWVYADIARAEFPTVPLPTLIQVLANTAPAIPADRGRQKLADNQAGRGQESLKEPFRERGYRDSEARELASKVARVSWAAELDPLSFAVGLAEVLPQQRSD